MRLKKFVELTGIEPATLALQTRCSPSWATAPKSRGYKKSSNPWWVWEDSNFRPPPYQSGALTDWATNPIKVLEKCLQEVKFVSSTIDRVKLYLLLRKEVIQPHLPVRLPCYDFAPVTNLTLNSSLPKVRTLALGTTGFHGVTGGVYKTRERIHRAMLMRDY